MVHEGSPTSQETGSDQTTSEPDLDKSPHQDDQDGQSPMSDPSIEDIMHVFQAQLNFEGHQRVNMLQRYHISQAQASKFGSLVDRGANGGLAGSDVRVLSRSGRKITVTGIDNHELTGLDIVTCAGLVDTNHGRVILIMNEYAYFGQGNSIHSPGQIEWYKNTCDDKSVKVGGNQKIEFLDGYALPLECRSGLMYIKMLGPPTDDDMDTYPLVFLTSPHEWDPSVLDYSHPEGPDNPDWAPDPDLIRTHDERIDPYGYYTKRVVLNLESLCDYTPDDSTANVPKRDIYLAKSSKEPVDYNKLRPYFGWVNADTIQKTMDHTTQWAESKTTFPMRKHIKSRFPALNVHRRQEPVATDTIFSKTPAVDSGVTKAQLFVGKDTLVADAYPLKSEKLIVNTLEDNIRQRGAMSQLINDYAKVEMSKKIMDILRVYHSSSWHSEPYHQNQNPAEGRYRTIKSWTNNIMNRTGAPANCWLLCLLYVCYLLNHIACAALDYEVPMFHLTGITPDISILLLYVFYQKVYYATHDQSFPSESEERAAYWVGFGEHVGDALTHKLLDAETNKVIYRSAVRPADARNPNKHSAPDGGELDPVKSPNPTVFVRTRQDDDPSVYKPMSDFDPDNLIGRTFLLPLDENGERNRATVTKKVVEQLEADEINLPQKINYLLDIGQGRSEQLVSYNQLLEHIERSEQEADGVFRFREITGHQGPLKPTDDGYRGSTYNVEVEWETGEKTYEPLATIAADDPVTCAVYAKKNHLLNKPGWKRFRSLARRQKVLAHQINQAKLRQARNAPVYMFGYRVPRNYTEALQLDKSNGNS
ncbi:hypothetical protein ACA910_007681 [Epithemia clementina (nom. ined.)]